jgi:nucleotidyltransferase substrate binding protein (TIGR01987 family)
MRGRFFYYHKGLPPFTYLGIICNSPKSCFREVFTVGLIKEDETIKLLEMTDDRNMTSHTYKEEVAQIIYGKLEEYSRLMENIIRTV